MSETDLLLRLALALGLGLLVGLQRQASESRLAGIRTFPLLALFGAFASALGEHFGGWPVAAGVVAVAALAVLGNWLGARGREDRDKDGAPDGVSADPGQTTEIAMLVVYLLGAYAVVGRPAVVVVAAGSVAVLLQLKAPLHRAIDSLGSGDLRAIIQFVLLATVLLPVTPDRGFGPYGVLNPRQIVWMVVLIVGIGLVGYLTYRFLGRRAGAWLGGLAGGLVSSTATTVSYARSSRGQEAAAVRASLALVVILLASTVVFLRVLVELAIVAPSMLAAAAPPLLAMAAAMGVLAVVELRRGERSKSREEIQLDNPSELGSALLFGVLYAAVLLAVAAAQDHFGTGGLYGVAVLGGLTDMDAITLGTARRVVDGELAGDVAWRVILVASMSNLVFKLGIVWVLGSRRLARALAPRFAALMVLGGLLVWLL